MTTNLSTFLPELRLHLGDLTSPYRYTDSNLETALIASVKALEKRWSSKYIIDGDDNVARNETSWQYTYASPPIVQNRDQRPIILMASIIIKGGSLENSAWSLGHWKDAEISYSNIEGGKSRNASLMRDIEELDNILPQPRQKLKPSLKGSLPGFKHNDYETKHND